MARSDDFTTSIQRFLRKSEKGLAACRATRRGGVFWTALLAGAGAGGGYLTATAAGGGGLALMIGGGAGAAAGITAASIVSYLRLRGAYGIRAAMVVVVVTSQRLLVFRQSWLNNRAAELVREMPLGDVTSIVVGEARWLRPHAVTIALAGGEAVELESAKIERPGALAEAFRSATGS